MANSIFPRVAHDWLAHELDRTLYRRAGKIKSGSGALGSGTVLGKVLTATVTSAAKSGGNTGNGTCTPDASVPAQSVAKAGVYTARCIEAALNGGTFEVKDPDGFSLGEVLAGATFNNDIKFVIADGVVDFAVGDGFDITVAAGGTVKFVPVNFAATDGSEKAAAILIDAADATSADAESAVLTGKAQIVASLLTWPGGATTSQKNTALAQLAALDIEDLQRL